MKLMVLVLALALSPSWAVAQDDSDDDLGSSPWHHVAWCGASVGLSVGAGSILARPAPEIGGFLFSLVLAWFSAEAARPCLYGQDARLLSGTDRFCDEMIGYTLPVVGVGVAINFEDRESTPKMTLPILAAGLGSAILRQHACTGFSSSQP